MNDLRFNRRSFLKHTSGMAAAIAAFPVLTPAPVLGAADKPGANGLINVGCIGVGPQGRGDMSGFLVQKDCRVVAVCDVKKDQLDAARAQVNQAYGNSECAGYGDFRELLARKDIDAVLIATPDHWHVYSALAAVRAGKDVYLEKPMGLSLGENWALRKEVHAHKRMFQFGTQQRSSRMFRLACELVRSGKIGRLKHINVWAPGSSPGGSTEVAPPPPGLDYEMWLGPAPYREHTKNLCTDDFASKTWWFISDFAIGFLAGWGIHPIDIAVWGGEALLSGPVEVWGRGSFQALGACDTATIWDVNMKFGSGVTMKFVGVPNGGNQGKATGDIWPQEQEWKQRYRRITSHGTAFEGTEGWVHVDREGINLQPENLIDLAEDSLPVQLTRSSHHVRNFLDAVKTRQEAICPIDESVWSDTLCHISELAIRANRKLVWDPKKERFIDDEGANLRLAARKPRGSWKL